MMIQVMATEEMPTGGYRLQLETWHINLAVCSSLRDMGTFLVEVNNVEFRSPICQIKLPQQTLYVSGFADGLLARAR